MSDLVAFETGSKVLVYHVWQDIKYTVENEMTNRPAHRGGSSTDVLRRLPRVVTGTLQIADELNVPTTDIPAEGNIQTKSKGEQRDAILALQGRPVTVTARSLPKGGIVGLMRMVTIDDDATTDNRLVVSFEVRELDEASFDFDDVEEDFIFVPFLIELEPDVAAPGAGKIPEVNSNISRINVVQLPRTEDGAVNLGDAAGVSSGTGPLTATLQKFLFKPAEVPYTYRIVGDSTINNPGLSPDVFVITDFFEWNLRESDVASGTDFSRVSNVRGARVEAKFSWNQYSNSYFITILRDGSKRGGVFAYPNMHTYIRDFDPGSPDGREARMFFTAGSSLSSVPPITPKEIKKGRLNFVFAVGVSE